MPSPHSCGNGNAAHRETEPLLEALVATEIATRVFLLVLPDGTEQLSTSSGIPLAFSSGAAESAALDSDLAALIDRWLRLADTRKGKIMEAMLADPSS